jgi:sulfur carrier protein ThiS
MEIQVRLFANLAAYAPPEARGGAARVELPEGATVWDLLARLRIPDEGSWLLLVNGRDVEATAMLRGGDVVDVLPPLVGG